MVLLAAAISLRAGAAGVDFSRDVQPVFAEHCLECHGPDKAKGGVNLTARETLIKEAKSGARAVVPGDLSASELANRITAADPEDRMPPKDKKPLTARDIEVLKQWVKEGAKFDLHWAYRPVVQPKPPEVRDQKAVIRNAIDRFVLAKLESKGIKPSPEADRYTLIRRVHYDLLGLPPSPEEVDAFVNDRSPLAYEEMVDRALASEHFGERWGRHWLDAARFADSDGYEKDRPRPDAWRYRDWVIHTINDDMPFDQFTIEQLAGDLLPDTTAEQIVATAFNRQTLTNTEGGTDQEQFRVEACMDRVETAGTVWLGLTVGCARCHSHKYDQITQKEYYQLFAYFNNGDEVMKQAPVSAEAWSDYEKANGVAARKLVALQKKLDEAKADLPAKLPDWEKGIQARLAEARAKAAKANYLPITVVVATAASKTPLKKQADGSFLAAGKAPKTDAYTLELTPGDKVIAALRIESMPDPSLPEKGAGRHKNGNFVLSEVKLLAGTSLAEAREVLLHSPKADYEQKGFEAKGALDVNGQTGWAVGGQTGKTHHLSMQLAEPIAPKPGEKVFLVLDQQYTRQPEHVIGRFRVLASSETTEESFAPSEVLRILSEEPKRRNPVVIAPLWSWMEKVDPDVVAANRALERARAKLPKPPLMDVRVIGQRVNNPRKTHLLYRGDFLDPAEEVVPATLSVLPPLKGPIASQRLAPPSRLDFARWLVSKDNPLTPRVTVNTIWGKLFGEGIVKTVADFGVRGEKPTHPELLDWLAAEFIRQGWSRKKLLKLILCSATYRQESKHRTELLDIDPKNELLHRQNRLRVEGEIVRDLYLAACGLLSPKIGGPSAFPPMPPDIAALSYAGNFSWTTSKGEDRFRRGMYTFFKRTAPYPDLTVFDCPDANLTNVKRTVSNTPLQALTTLNAEAFNEAAQAMSRHLLSESFKSDDERLVRAFRLCVARPPQPGELAALRKLISDSRCHYQVREAEAKELIGAYAIKGIPAAESAAWVATARIVLNMDEFITRE